MLTLIQGIKEAQDIEANLRRTGHTSVHGHTLSTSLLSIQEDSDTSDAVGQLPTPRETPQPEGQPLPTAPVVSDTLFAQMDSPLESDDSSAGRTRTAASGNPLFTVVDRSGVFDMEIIFCVCSTTVDTYEQLLQSRLFPATFKQIETLFTFSVLEDFLTDNLECKTTAQQYYSKLQSMTSKMFPISVPVCFSSILLSTSNQ